MVSKIGIYSITCKVEDKVHGIYVGQSSNVPKRFRDHRTKLKRKCHLNSRLQRLYDKYGMKSLRFEILEECLIDTLTLNEEKWYNHFKRQDLPVCNMNDFVDSPMRGRNHTEETKKRLQEKSRLQKRQPMSAETKRKIGDSKKGNTYFKGKTHSPETRKRMSEAKKGKPVNWEQIEKLRQLNWGGTLSQETRDKLKGRGRLTAPEIVRQIRKLYETEKISKVNLMEQFGIPKNRLDRILNHESPYDGD